MQPDEPAALAIPLSRVAELAVEVWRIRQAISGQEQFGRGIPGLAALRFAARAIERMLADLGVETTDLRGQPYHPGMCMVVEQMIGAAASTQDSPAEVTETLEPTILLRGSVILPGRVVVTLAAREASENARDG